MPILKEKPAYNISAPAVIDAAAAKFLGYLVVTGGTSGSLVLNDCETLAEASAANTIASIPYTAVTPATNWPFEWPLTSGLVVSQVPEGAVVNLIYAIWVI